MLKAAGWIELDWQVPADGQYMTLNRQSTGRTRAGSIPSATGLGIVVRSADDPQVLSAANALRDAAREENVVAEVIIDVPVSSTNAPAIHLIVGAKPR